MRAVHFEDAPLDDAFQSFMDLCVQCRGCETACPSSVPFGRLMEGAREMLARETRYQPWWRRLGLRLLGRHRLLLALSSALAVLQRARLVPRRLGLPPLPVRRRPLVGSGTDVWLFTGCVMDAWARPVHAAAQRVIEATGAGVSFPGPGGACCGALATHAGLADDARTLAERVIASMPGDRPVVVDSAGCGAMLKDYGHLLGTDAAKAFAARVVDIHEWLAPRIDQLPVPPAGQARPVIAVQDPCHLRHVQRAHTHVRTVLAPFADLRELDDEGLCCGAGGAYSVDHPDMAADLRSRKLAAVDRTGAAEVVSANPGCGWHLAAGGAKVRHPIEVIDEAIRGR